MLGVLPPNSPKLVFKPQTPRLRYFERFDNFVLFILLFWAKGLLCKSWS